MNQFATENASGNSRRGREVEAKAKTAPKEELSRIRQEEGRGWVRDNLRDLADCLTGLAGSEERR